MIQAQMMRLGLAGNPDGSDKASITLRLFDKKLNLEGFEEMIYRRAAEIENGLDSSAGSVQRQLSQQQRKRNRSKRKGGRDSRSRFETRMQQILLQCQRPTVFVSRHKLVMWWLCLSIPRMFPSDFWWDW